MTVADRTRPKLTALARWALFWTLFIGVGALWGTVMMWAMANVVGMGPLLDQMQKLPLANVFFTNFTWPGVFLLVIIGLPNLAGAALTLRCSRVAPFWTIGCGVILIGWICFQLFIAFGPNPLSLIYLVFGLTQATLAVAWTRKASVRITSERLNV